MHRLAWVWALVLGAAFGGCSGETIFGGGAGSSSATGPSSGPGPGTTASNGSGGGGVGGGAGGGDPCDCSNDNDVPVCGVDGMTYNANCGRECVPVQIACDGECPCTCDALVEQYLVELENAKACSPATGADQCTELAGDELPCPCSTFVNPENEAAIAALREIIELWKKHDCAKGFPCPEIACIEPAGAVCSATDNHCQDVNF